MTATASPFSVARCTCARSRAARRAQETISAVAVGRARVERSGVQRVARCTRTHLRDRAARERRLIEFVEHVAERRAECGLDLPLGVAEAVDGRARVQLGERGAQPLREHVRPHARPLSPLDERRARALEQVVAYRPNALKNSTGSANGAKDDGGDGSQGRRRRRRRRGRRRPDASSTTEVKEATASEPQAANESTDAKSENNGDTVSTSDDSSQASRSAKSPDTTGQ